MNETRRIHLSPSALDEARLSEIAESLKVLDDVIVAYRDMALELKESRFMLAAILLTNGPVRITPKMIRELDDRTEIVRVDRLDGTIEFAARPPMQGAPREQVEAGE